MNNNQALIDGLRQAADFLEAKPNLPDFGKQTVRLWVYNKDVLKEAARELGSFTKDFTDSFFNLKKPIVEGVLDIEVTISRDQVCRREVIWHCPDDESLLALEPETLETA